MATTSTNKLINQLAQGTVRATAAQLAQIAGEVSQATLAPDLLEVDAPLWGSFWQFDVLSPGYRLPAAELALLRATRLDRDWPLDTGLAQFLADLQQAVRQPQAGIWALLLEGEPCLVFAAPLEPTLVTVAWYCATTGYLHAGYKSRPAPLPPQPAFEQRSPQLSESHRLEPAPSWLRQVVEQSDLAELSSLAARLDYEILRRRLSLAASEKT